MSHDLADLDLQSRSSDDRVLEFESFTPEVFLRSFSCLVF